MVFPKGGVPVRIAAQVYGKDPNWVRAQIRAGLLPIGICTQSEHRTNYYISPKLLYEHTGYIWEGEK